MTNTQTSGCLFLFSLVVDIISMMWIVAASIMIRDTVVDFYVIFNSGEIEQKKLNIHSAKKNSSGSPKGGGYSVYTLRGNIEESDHEVKTVLTSIELDNKKIQNIIDSKKIDIWYLPYSYRNGSFTAPLVVYPKIEDIVNRILTSLFLMFFIPLGLLIRLIYYYDRSIWKGIIKPFK